MEDPYLAATDILGDGWTFLITREAFFGATRFQDFYDRLNIPKARLTERLKHLVSNGMFERKLKDDTSRRYVYRFSAKGLAIYPIALSMIEWGLSRDPTLAKPNLVHASCGQPLRTQTVCHACRAPVTRGSLTWAGIRPVKELMAEPAKTKRWRRLPASAFDDVSLRPDPAIDAMRTASDRWSMLIIYGALQTETFAFREAQSKLGLAHNILSERLKHLQSQGVLEKVDDTKRSAYRLTESGDGMLAMALSVRTWGRTWLNPEHGSWVPLIHSCGSSAEVVPICMHCSEVVTPDQVSIVTGRE